MREIGCGPSTALLAMKLREASLRMTIFGVGPLFAAEEGGGLEVRRTRAGRRAAGAAMTRLRSRTSGRTERRGRVAVWKLSFADGEGGGGAEEESGDDSGEGEGEGFEEEEAEEVELRPPRAFMRAKSRRRSRTLAERVARTETATVRAMRRTAAYMREWVRSTMWDSPSTSWRTGWG